MEIFLIGGPKHGEKFEMPTTPPKINLNKKQTLHEGKNINYTICVTGDGHYYGVYEPVNDPSYLRVMGLRNAITEAMSK